MRAQYYRYRNGEPYCEKNDNNDIDGFHSASAYDDKLIHYAGNHPGDNALRRDDAYGERNGFQFFSYRRYRRHAGSIQQSENQKRIRACRGKRGGDTAGDKNTERGYDRFFRAETRDKGRADAPVRKAERLEYRGNKTCDCGEHTLRRVGNEVESDVERLQEPYDNRRYEYNGKGFDDKVFRFFPHKQKYAFG